MQLTTSAKQVRVGDRLYFPGSNGRKSVFAKVLRVSPGAFGRLRLWIGAGYFSEREPMSTVLVERATEQEKH